MTRFPFLHRRQFLSVACLIVLMLSFNPAKASQTDITGPANSVAFGTSVTVLPNGNIVVTDPMFGPGANHVGAVYLYNGATLALISTLTGSTTDDQVGKDGITVLINGNYVVRSSLWDNPSPLPVKVDAGAVTWCSATTGCAGTVSSGNSLIGGTGGDVVGQDSVTPLTNGNYVVRSQFWDDPVGPVADVGAVTWGNGAGGTVGLLKTISLIGGTASDRVGTAAPTALTNGNYVVPSSQWNKPAPGAAVTAGAATWGNGTTGFPHAKVDSSNSLIGGTAGDNVGSGGVTALTNGNYVVRSTSWDNPSGPKVDAGAVTWGNGAGGTTGSVDSTNSLVGGTTNDFVGGAGVLALTNGNYVVGSNAWNKPAPGAVTVAGAVTWSDGTTGLPHGFIDSSNSLIGGTPSDQVGGSGITALTNGNYVVASGQWDNPALGASNNAGAATWGNGLGGTIGLVASGNSLIGGTASDNVGGNGVTALTNGNYVVKSPSWNTFGAATWCNGTTFTSSSPSSGNSLTGGTAGDGVGSVIVALNNGNYVVLSQNWDIPAVPGPLVANVGAVTWCNGTTFTSAVVNSGNSLIGGTASDSVGSSNVFPLTNGNYVVSSTNWDNPSGPKVDAGAVTWGNGLGGTVGSVTSANSLVGGTASDNVGFGGVRSLTNGNYAVQSNNWHNGATNTGAATFGNGTIGTAGSITSANSVLGTAASGISTFAFDATRNRLFVGRSASNIVSVLFFQTTATSDGNINSVGTWGSGVPTALTNVIIPSPRVVTVNTASTIGSLDLASGATLTMSANLNVTGGLTLGTQIDTGANTLALSCSSAASGASSSIFITGNLKRDFCATGSGFSYPTNVSGFSGGGAATGAFTYPVGTTANGNEFSPLAVTVTALGNNLPLETSVPSSLTVKANYGTIAPLDDTKTLDRYWTLTESGDLTANLVFNYLQTDVDGTEGNYRIIRVSGGSAVIFPNACPAAPCVDTAANTATINNVPTFSDWTLGETQPTAANARVSGQILDTNGTPVEGAVIRLGGTQNRKFITDANGFYRFDNVVTGGFYTVTPSRVNYTFSPATRSFSQLGDSTEATFGATLATSNLQNPLDTPEYFVRQHYLDFLGREPDEAGFNFWSDQILECGADQSCIDRRRENVSAAYFLSIEFQQTGGLVDGLYRASYGVAPQYAAFMPDVRQVGNGVIVGADNWQATLQANKEAFVNNFVNRPTFVGVYGNMDNSLFVDTLIQHTGASFTAAERDALVIGLGTGAMSRGEALRSIAENQSFVNAKFNQAFVMMEYFAYLRRDTDASGYAFWLNKLNQFGGNFEQAEMVKAFIVSGEYRDRFPR